MRIRSAELLRLHVPLRRPFTHGRAQRAASDVILVKLGADDGSVGMGEILARGYVTGETNDSIFDAAGPRFVKVVSEVEFTAQRDVVDFACDAVSSGEHGPALVGGVELALLSLLAQRGELHLASLIGPPRQSPTTKCLTVGLDADGDALRRQAMLARVGEVGVIKLKVSTATDSARVRALSDHLHHEIPIRLDANGTLTLQEAVELLGALPDVPVESIEEPLPKSMPSYEEALRTLFERTGITLVADESLVGMEDAARWAASGAFQCFNVRVGKCGGLSGAVRLLDFAGKHNIAVVCGTMVGETTVLGRASELLLEHRDDLSYVEGLGQHRTVLAEDPVETPPQPGPSRLGPLQLTATAEANLVVRKWQWTAG